MKPLECAVCGLKAGPADAAVKWHFERAKKLSENFLVVHDRVPCNEKGAEGYFNRALPFEYVWKHIPEFISYVSRNERALKELKKFVHSIEKDRSYIRRHIPDKKEVKKLIIRLEGFGD